MAAPERVILRFLRPPFSCCREVARIARAAVESIIQVSRSINLVCSRWSFTLSSVRGPATSGFIDDVCNQLSDRVGVVRTKPSLEVTS